MRLFITSIALLMASVLGIASAQDNQATPKFDASCCMFANGFMMSNGNVCDTPDTNDSVTKFESCCTRSGGRSKCKYGYRDPKNWPPADTYSCKA
ncbi:hypothetical protein EC957_005452 [Mortierella hygrophila]|uniref:Uncharacterized protein n=1 Tax=Mortierella hygrophila TaxID=979708 RepID=A0A9P6JZP7_9FUNG|nr:hypothetical protein EC957_005452 [Mortierella hygrophila]